MSLGTAACPPYHLALVVGGTSAEQNLKTVKLASCKYYDELPTEGNAGGRAYRDTVMEKEIEQWARETEIGAQFGGKYFVHDVRVIRLPRHGASCPVGIGVSCSADRQIKGKITKDGVFLEQLEEDPAKFLPENQGEQAEAINIDLNKPMEDILSELDKHPVATRVMLNGTLLVARDIAHAKLLERLKSEGALPDYFKNHPVYYAGPAKTPEGHASGSFGPTTSQRMDPYVDEFQANGGPMVMLGKGNRSKQVTEACKKHGGFYLGSIGGPAARFGKDCIKKVEVQEYKELGMEAIWKIQVENFPAFIIVDNKGNDFSSRSKRINRMILLIKLHDPIQADLLMSFLDAHGVDAIRSTDDAGGLEPQLTALSGVKIFVKEASLYKAKNLVEEFMSADRSLSEDFDPGEAE